MLQHCMQYMCMYIIIHIQGVHSYPLTVQVTMSSLWSPPPPPSPLGATVGAAGQTYKHKMMI